MYSGPVIQEQYIYHTILHVIYIAPDVPRPCWSTEYSISCKSAKYANLSLSVQMYVCIHILEVKVVLESPFLRSSFI